MWSRDKLSRDGPGPRIILSQLSGNSSLLLGLAPPLRTPKIGPLVRAPEPDLQNCKLGAQR